MAYGTARSEDGSVEVYFTPEQWRALHDVSYPVFMQDLRARARTLVDYREEPVNRCLVPTGSYIQTEPLPET